MHRVLQTLLALIWYIDIWINMSTKSMHVNVVFYGSIFKFISRLVYLFLHFDIVGHMCTSRRLCVFYKHTKNILHTLYTFIRFTK